MSATQPVLRTALRLFKIDFLTFSHSITVLFVKKESISKSRKQRQQKRKNSIALRTDKKRLPINFAKKLA